MGEDYKTADPISSNLLYRLFEMELKIEILRMFKDISESIEHTVNKIQRV